MSRPESRPFGNVSGFMLKTARQSAAKPISQEGFAEAIGIDTTTVQSWEAGRRSLAVVSMMQMRRLCQRLLQLGADVELVAMLPIAVEADLVLTATVDPKALDRPEQHPLAGSVMDLRLTELLTWVLSGMPPRFAAHLGPTRRRGPTPTRPELAIPDQRALKASLLELSEYRACGDSNVLLRRQACFLAGLAGLNAATELSPRASAYLVKGEIWTPSWADARSYAVSRAYGGDVEPLRAFLTHTSDDCETAALNYTAYWVGDLATRQGDDTFMVGNYQRWRGTHMYPHLVDRLQADHRLIDLNIHNLWLLVRSQRGLVLDDADTTNALLAHIEPLADSDQISGQSRRELLSMRTVIADLGYPTGETRT